MGRSRIDDFCCTSRQLPIGTQIWRKQTTRQTGKSKRNETVADNQNREWFWKRGGWGHRDATQHHAHLFNNSKSVYWFSHNWFGSAAGKSAGAKCHTRMRWLHAVGVAWSKIRIDDFNLLNLSSRRQLKKRRTTVTPTTSTLDDNTAPTHPRDVIDQCPKFQNSRSCKPLTSNLTSSESDTNLKIVW